MAAESRAGASGDKTLAQKARRWLSWWPGATLWVVVATVFLGGLAEWYFGRPDNEAILSLTRIALTIPTLPVDVVRAPCAGETLPKQRLAHVHMVLWNSGRAGEADSMAVHARVVDLRARLEPDDETTAGKKGPTPAPALMWAGVTGHTSNDGRDLVRFRCRGDVLDVRWRQALGPGGGMLIEAIYDVGDADPARLHVSLAQAAAAAFPAPGDAEDVSPAKLDDHGGRLPAPNKKVAATRYYLVLALWLAALVIAAFALHRAVSDLLFGLHGAAAAFMVVFVLFGTASVLVFKDRVVLYMYFPTALLPDR